MQDNIKKLREMTGAGVMECKKALDDAKGNVEEAVKLIHERGLIKAEKKQGRRTGAGLLEFYIHNERVGVMLEIRAETDFVVRSEPFRFLAHEIAMQIAAMNPDDVPSLMALPYIKDEALTVETFIKRTVAKVGENITITRFCRYEV